MFLIKQHVIYMSLFIVKIIICKVHTKNLSCTATGHVCKLKTFYQQESQKTTTIALWNEIVLYVL